MSLVLNVLTWRLIEIWGFPDRRFQPSLSAESAGIMVNAKKTKEVDPNHLYLAITPKIQDSTLIHQVAHILDYLKGSGNSPGPISR